MIHFDFYWNTKYFITFIYIKLLSRLVVTKMLLNMLNCQPAVKGSCAAAAAAAAACAEDDVIESSRDCAILTINYSTKSSHLQHT